MKRIRLALALLLASSAIVSADVSEKLSSYEQEAHNLAADLPRPNATTSEHSQRRLVDAQVAFSLGDYDTAALTLFDLAGTTTGPDKDTATYYLAEALYQKGDRGAARTYFVDVAGSPANKYYQLALVRLVEIAIVQNDPAAATESLSKLDAIDPAQRLPSATYIHGKFAFSEDKLDDAAVAFASVPKGSTDELQALFYLGATQVAKKDFGKATDIYSDLITRKPRTAADRRVIELGQLALGRLYYEREQPSKAIDSYLLIDRHSDLFRDALYEVAWVYVKSKQYDKALRALELLEQSDPSSTKTPTTRILEGNLRIRKAQSIRLAQVNGTAALGDASDPGVEYDKAAKIFSETHDLYLPSYQMLAALVGGNLDAAAFVEQIAGRQSHVFQTGAPIPDAAAQWLREQPEVQRVVGVEIDLGTIQADIAESEETIVRLEGVLAGGDRNTVYPKLASRRSRISSIQDDLIAIRTNLAEQELGLVGMSGDLAQVSSARRQLAQQYAGLGDPERAYNDRVAAAHAGFEKINGDVVQIEGVIDATQALSVAMRKAATEQGTSLTADQKAQIQSELDAAAKDAQGIEDELADVRHETTLGKDLSGVGDQGITQARELRRQLKAAQDAEHRILAGYASSSRDRNRSQGLVALGDRAARLADQLDLLDQQIDRSIAQGLEEVKLTLAEVHNSLTAYKQELAEYETEGRTVGATVLAGSFKDVKAKLDDVIVRTDVGVVDVSWSQKEDNDDDLKRLGLARNRELKQLNDEFKDVLEDAGHKPAPHEQKTTNTLPPPEANANPTERVAPVDAPAATAPTVKPDEPKKTPAPAPKKGGAR